MSKGKEFDRVMDYFEKLFIKMYEEAGYKLHKMVAGGFTRLDFDRLWDLSGLGWMDFYYKCARLGKRGCYNRGVAGLIILMEQLFGQKWDEKKQTWIGLGD